MFDLSQSTEGSVALYCRKVLINNKAESVLPKWLRFVKGAWCPDVHKDHCLQFHRRTEVSMALYFGKVLLNRKVES